MTSNERATAFYNKYLAGNMREGWDEGWDEGEAKALISDLEEAFREASREATREAADAGVRLWAAVKNYDNTKATP